MSAGRGACGVHYKKHRRARRAATHAASNCDRISLTKRSTAASLESISAVEASLAPPPAFLAFLFGGIAEAGVKVFNFPKLTGEVTAVNLNLSSFKVQVQGNLQRPVPVLA